MLRYTLESLSSPATYLADPELTRIARRAATNNYQCLGNGKMGMGEFKTAAASGQYPEIVLAEIENLNAEEIKKLGALEHARIAVEMLDLPIGWTAEITTKNIILRGPYNVEMPPRLRRMGGDWDRDEKVWKVPHAKADSLKRVFGNVEKVEAAKAAAKAAANEFSKKTAEIAEQAYRINREKQHQQDLAEAAAKAAAIADRVKVPVGKYQIGDTVNTKKGPKIVTSFGKSWTENSQRIKVTDESSSAYGFEPGLDYYPIITVGDGGTFCYAYFD